MYQFIIKKPAKKFIDGLPVNERRRIVDAGNRGQIYNLKQRVGGDNAPGPPIWPVGCLEQRPSYSVV